MSKIISLVNGKGGVGKTASSVNLAAGLTLEGYSVLILDLDKQANTTKHFKAYDPKRLSIYDVLINGVNPLDAIRKTEIEKLDIIPAVYEIEDAADKILLDINKSRTKRLKKIEDLDYDYIIIDCPPDLGIITINALTISDYVLVPITCDMWALEGFDKITSKMDMVRNEYNSKLKLLGVFVTLDNSTKVNKDMKIQLSNNFKEKFFQTAIRRSTKFSQSTFQYKPVIISDPKSTVGEDYKNFTKEVIKNV